jgi:hypothetical protein
MSMIKSNYLIDIKDTHQLANLNGNLAESNFVRNHPNQSSNHHLVLPSSCNTFQQNPNTSVITNDIVNKIKKNLEQKAFMISKQQNVKALTTI